MKKLSVLFLAIALVMVYVMPASALESVFKGYWRTRAFTMQNPDGEDGTEITDWSGVDTRTRLFYTAIINDNLKFVNAFEIDAVWGSTAAQTTGKDAALNPTVNLKSGKTAQVGMTAGGYQADGDIATDGTGLEVKHSYVDFNVGPAFAKVGLQPLVLARGFLWDDDVAGAIVGAKVEQVTIPLIFVAPYEGGLGFNKRDVYYFAVAPSFKAADMANITLLGMYAYSKNVSSWNPYVYDGPDFYKLGSDLGVKEMGLGYAGFDVDLNFKPVSVWLTGIYEFGSLDLKTPVTENGKKYDSVDVKAYLGAVGGKFDFGMGDVHFEGFYATGDKDDNSVDETTAFFVPVAGTGITGQVHYWAEIMGYGVFDNWKSQNSPGVHVSDIMAGGLGVTVKPMPELSVRLDGWYAALAEDIEVEDAKGNIEKVNDLGIEVDLRITYQLVQNLNLDLVGAYLFAGDATNLKAAKDADPYEVGAQLSLSF